MLKVKFPILRGRLLKYLPDTASSSRVTFPILRGRLLKGESGCVDYRFIESFQSLEGGY